MKLVGYAFRHPYSILVAVVGVVALGVVSFFRLPKDLLPLINEPAVQILTTYTGMPAEVMEGDITVRLERWTDEANGIARQESRSMLGVSVIRNYFRPDIDINSAIGQVIALAMSDLKFLPPGTQPPIILPFDPMASVPLVLVTLSGKDFDETRLYDIANYDLRSRLEGIPGVIAPTVYGGKVRAILTYVDPKRLWQYDLSPLDVVHTLDQSNTLIPTGDVKFGDRDYQIVTDGLVDRVSSMDQFPLRSARTGRQVLVSEVGKTEDAARIQTNIVRVDGRREVYIPVYRQPGANTLAVVDGIRNSIQDMLSRLPKGLSIKLVGDQSEYVRMALRSLTQETVQGGLIAVLMIALFLGSLRTSLAAAFAIPLSYLAAFLGLLAIGDSLNAMTLGGLTLALGPLVDLSIVVVENVMRHRHEGLESEKACLLGTEEVGPPVLAATITTVIVFVPVFFMTGISRFLFAPLGRTVALAIGASFLVAMAVTPLVLQRLLPKGEVRPTWFERKFERVQAAYRGRLPGAIARRRWILSAALVLLGGTVAVVPRLGLELFPVQDVGQLSLKVRFSSGLRVERTEERVAAIEKSLPQVIPADEIRTVVSNIGVLYGWPAAYTPNAGPQDAFLEVQLGHRRSQPTGVYADRLRDFLRRTYPDAQVVADSGSLLTAALTEGLPAPLDIQIVGNDLQVSNGIAQDIVRRIQGVPGLADVRIQQRLDYPELYMHIRRRKAADMGLTTLDVVKNVLTATNSSTSFDRLMWIDHQRGNQYFVGAQYPEASLDTFETLQQIPITGPLQDRAVPLSHLVSFSQTKTPTEINHLDISRVMDIFAGVSGRDLGHVVSDVEARIAGIHPPEGYQVRIRGEMQTLRESFSNLAYGFLLATFLVFLVLVAQLKSLKDPVIILAAVPLGLVGVVGALGLTHTAFSIPAFLGTVFMIGIVVSNSILIVEFANRKRLEGLSGGAAVVEAAAIRLRPILMTALATILGLLPMALGLGEGAEVNVPLARAIIGGALASTLLSLVVVPCLYRILHGEESAR